MSIVHIDDVVSVWVDGQGIPERLVWNGVHYRVSDEPTLLQDILLGAITHPPAIQGWRFQGTSETGESRVFDVREEADQRGWTLLNVWK